MVLFSLEGKEKQRRHPSGKMAMACQAKNCGGLDTEEYSSFWGSVGCQESLEDHKTSKFVAGCNQIKVHYPLSFEHWIRSRIKLVAGASIIWKTLTLAFPLISQSLV
jgi:hypothetical protein